MARTAFLSIAAVALLCAAALAQTFDQAASAARLALDAGGDVDQAARLLETAAAESPSRASEIAVDLSWCRVEQAFAAMRSSRWDAAELFFEEAVRVWPDARARIARPWAVARAQVFWTRLSAARANPSDEAREAAVQYAADTVSLAADLPHAHRALGAALEWAGRSADAREEFLLAAGDRAGNNRSLEHLRDAARAASEAPAVYDKPLHPLQLVVDSGPERRLKRWPFVICHYNQALAERLLSALDLHVSQPVLDGLLEPNPSFPYECRVYLHRSRREFMQATGRPAWANGYSLVKGSGGKIERVEIHLFQQAPRLLGDVARHELAHARLFMGPLGRADLPGWVREGVSINAESERARRMCAAALDRARAAGALVDVAKVMRAADLSPDENDAVLYAECCAILDVLCDRGGADKLRAFIDAAPAQDPVAALLEVYGLEPAAFEDLILGWIDANR